MWDDPSPLPRVSCVTLGETTFWVCEGWLTYPLKEGIDSNRNSSILIRWGSYEKRFTIWTLPSVVSALNPHFLLIKMKIHILSGGETPNNPHLPVAFLSLSLTCPDVATCRQRCHLREGGPLPGPESGLRAERSEMSCPRRHACWRSKRLYWEGVRGQRAAE